MVNSSKYFIHYYPDYFFVIRSLNTEKQERDLIERNINDKLIITSDPFLIYNKDKSILVNQDFQGSVTIKYNGYYKQGNELSEYSNVYYGTNNQVIFKNKDKEIKIYIFLKGQKDKLKFYQLVDFLIDSTNLEVKEYFRGELAYKGKKLNYKQIQELKK